MSVLDGPGEGTWSVFAVKVVEQRDTALAEVQDLKKIESLEAQLELAHKFHDLVVKERDYERVRNRTLQERVNEAEERGALWVLQRHGHGLTEMTREEYAKEICQAARKNEK